MKSLRSTNYADTIHAGKQKYERNEPIYWHNCIEGFRLLHGGSCSYVCNQQNLFPSTYMHPNTTNAKVDPQYKC